MNVSRTYNSPYERVDWLAAQILWVVYFTITLYLFLGLIVYLVRHRKEQQVTRKRGLLMYGFVTAAFVLALVEMAVNEWGIIHMMESGEVCEAWRQTHHLTFITSLVPGYIFLWIRQHAFYRDAMLRTMVSKRLAVFSWVVLASFFLGYGFFISFFGSPAYTKTHEYVITDMACYSGKHKNVSTLFYGIAICLLIFYQTSLLFLFTYPIWRSSKEDNEVSETMEVIMGYIRKCRLLTSISAGTDILAFFCSLFLKRLWNAPLTVLTTIYDIDLLINLCCLLLCLKPWKDIVLPFRTQKSSSTSYRTQRSYVNSEVRSSDQAMAYRPVSNTPDKRSSDPLGDDAVFRMVSLTEEPTV